MVVVSNINQEVREGFPFLVAASASEDGTQKEFRSLLQFNYNYLPVALMTNPTIISKAELVLYPADAGFVANKFPNSQSCNNLNSDSYRYAD
ncbi:MAG: hypothetical protein ABI688_06790 [Bacteroidota bacterium]